MGLGTSIFLIALGAILKWAVVVPNSHGINVNRIGLIIFIVGIVGLVVSMFFWSSWGGFGGYRRRTVTRHYGDPDRGGPVDGPGRGYGPGGEYGPGRGYDDPRSTYIDERERY
ncbi:MAG: hypothetical protein J2P58_02355 [Acidimicrobiaceae bacterium]|nr:hypothetical protein [Acidimicrobiaceae bacterium]MBO0748784.1 hypothetical protein [Acidimicrobiaceae bacterium]